MEMHQVSQHRWSAAIALNHCHHAIARDVYKLQQEDNRERRWGKTRGAPRNKTVRRGDKQPSAVGPGPPSRRLLHIIRVYRRISPSLQGRNTLSND